MSQNIGPIVDAINDVAAALREHTSHVRLDDERWWDFNQPKETEEADDVTYDEASQDTLMEQNRKRWSEEQPKTVFTSAGEESWFNEMMNKYFGAREKLVVNMNYGSAHPDTVQDVSNEIKKVNEERRNVFEQRASWRSNQNFPLSVSPEIQFVLRETLHEYRRPPRAKYQTVPSTNCEFCGLTSRNPVHSVQLRTGDDIVY